MVSEAEKITNYSNTKYSNSTIIYITTIQLMSAIRQLSKKNVTFFFLAFDRQKQGKTKVTFFTHVYKCCYLFHKKAF